jgi:predicted DNA repair protein MutK
MATTGLLALLDDITALLDDVALYSKIAAKKSAGVLGDDLALNAQQVSGVEARRELPVVWAVARGSFLNKLIIVPAALVLSEFLPGLVTPLLMLGGLYLCYEGAEKVAHHWWGKGAEASAHREGLVAAARESDEALLAAEKAQVKGAIRTDFVLSAEIIVIALGTVQSIALLPRAVVLSVVAIIATVGVYGLVAAIVKLDDLGLALTKGDRPSLSQTLGRGILAFAPWLMRSLAVLGTVAMFLVGGSILRHGIPLPVEEWVGLPSLAVEAALGVGAGALGLGLVRCFRGLRP